MDLSEKKGLSLLPNIHAALSITEFTLTKYSQQQQDSKFSLQHCSLFLTSVIRTQNHDTHLHCENPLIKPSVSYLSTELFSKMTEIVIAIVWAKDLTVKQKIKPNQTQNFVPTCPSAVGSGIRYKSRFSPCAKNIKALDNSDNWNRFNRPKIAVSRWRTNTCTSSITMPA